LKTWRVGINAHLLSREASYRSAGIHGYILNLLRCLPAVPEAADLQYIAFVGQGQLESGERLRVARSAWPTQRPAVRVLWEQLALPWYRLDLLHGLGFVNPLLARCPSVVTVYDLSYLHYPRALPASRRLYLHLFTRASCRRARRIIAISESTRRDLVKQWGLSPGKIGVARPGVGEHFRPLPPAQVVEFRARRGLPDRFILHVGTLQPRKNLVRLVQAFEKLVSAGESITLVLAGDKGWMCAELLAEIERLKLTVDVLQPGFVPEEELPFWYNAAAVVAYPSLYEGFGLPVVEAMACGTPVVASNVSAMPEAAGYGERRAALLVDPADTDAMADALHEALTKDILREELRVKGFQQAATLTWFNTAADTVANYRLAMGAP